MNNFTLCLRNSRGQSLVQVMVGVGIMGILMMAMVSMQTSMGNQNQALAEKLASLDVLRQLTLVASTPVTCGDLFLPGNLVTPGTLNFNSTAVSASTPHVVALKTVPGIGPAAPAIVTQNRAPSSLSNSLFVPNGGVSIQVTGPSSANLVVAFQQNSLIRPIHNLSLPLTLTTTGPANNALITGCFNNASSPGVLAEYRASDIAGMTPSTTYNAGGQYLVGYNFPQPIQAVEQNVAINAQGVWDINACTSMPPCNVAVTAVAIVAGNPVFCGRNGYYAPGGAYNSVFAGQTSCVVHVPANATFSLMVTWDGRWGAVPNFNNSSYSYEGVGQNPKLVTIISLK